MDTRSRIARGLVSTMLALATTGLVGCGEKPIAAAVPPQPVRVTTVAFDSGETVRSLTGIVKARVESDLGFRVGGKIIKRYVDVGRRVQPGEVIAELDPTDFQLAMETQDAELRAATSSRSQAVAAEGRYRELLKNGFVAQAALEQRQATADEARQRVEKALKAIETAKNQLAYTKLTADAAGVIAALPVDVGQVVTTGQTVARLAKAGELEVQVAVPEQSVADLASASTTVDLWADGRATYDAVLREVSPEADAGSRTFLARYTIKAPGSTVSLGMTATVKLRTARGQKVAHLPIPAVLNDGRGTSVFVVDADGRRITRTPVTMVSYGRSDVVISGGVANGQRIVALGTHLLDEARDVRVVETVAASDLSGATAR